MATGKRRRAAQTVSTEEAAGLLGIHVETVLASIRRGEIRALRFGRIYRIPKRVINELLGCEACT